MTTTTNDPKRVTTVRGLVGGYMFYAPVGTALPTDNTTSLNPAFVNAGFVSADGWVESVDISTTDGIPDVNGTNVIAPQPDTYTEKITCTLMDISKGALALEYGTKNVTDVSGKLTVKHNWGNTGEHFAVVLELVLKDDKKWRKVIPDCNVTSLGEVKLNKSTVAGREVELSYSAGSDGSGCFDYIDSPDTTTA